MSLQVELSEEKFFELLVEELKSSLECFEQNLEEYIRGGKPDVFYFQDPVNDIEAIVKHINALKTVISWYGVDPEGQ